MAESGTLDYLPAESIVLQFFCATRYDLPGKALPLSTFSVAFNSLIAARKLTENQFAFY